MTIKLQDLGLWKKEKKEKKEESQISSSSEDDLNFLLSFEFKNIYICLPRGLPMLWDT
jgi:hypothetical protein